MMKLKSKNFNLELDQNDINRLEEELFTITMNYDGKIGTESQKAFKEDNIYLSKLYGLISKFKDTSDED